MPNRLERRAAARPCGRARVRGGRRGRFSGGDLMATKITRDVLESYLRCQTKAHLKLKGPPEADRSAEHQVGLRGPPRRVEGTGEAGGYRHDSHPAPGGIGGQEHPPDRLRLEGGTVVRAGRHPGRRPPVAPLRRAEEGGRGLGLGRLPLRPVAVTAASSASSRSTSWPTCPSTAPSSSPPACGVT
jgi:hypothetical protein